MFCVIRTLYYTIFDLVTEHACRTFILQKVTFYLIARCVHRTFATDVACKRVSMLCDASSV